MGAVQVLLLVTYAMSIQIGQPTAATSVHCLAALLKLTNRTSCSLLYATDRHYAPCTVSTPEDQAALFVAHGQSLYKPGHSALQRGPHPSIDYNTLPYLAYPRETGKLAFVNWRAGLNLQVPCPPEFQSWRDSCFYVSTVTASYNTSVTACAAFNGSLMKVTDPFAKAAVKANLLGDTWVGLTYLYTQFKWRGSLTGLHFDKFPNGAGHENADYHDRCTYIDAIGVWVLSQSCDQGRAFICERSPVINGNCPRAYTQHGSTCHLFVATLKGFDAAHMHCTDLYGYLVTINDAQEEAAVEALRVGEVWIGFARLRMWSWPDGSRWLEGQSTANFIPGKPGLFDKWSYLTADGDLSATADEEQLMYYICEVDKVSALQWSSWMPSSLDPWDLEATSTMLLAGLPVDCDIRMYAFDTGDLTNCINDRLGSTYVGTKNTTVSGKTCQSWESKIPHWHLWNFRYSNWPSLEAAQNYCVGDGNHYGPWCYTTDPDVVWEPCYIPLCPYFREYLCKTTREGWEYVGQRAVDSQGTECMRWDEQTYYRGERFPERSLKAAANYCRNPNLSHLGPWCYIRLGVKKLCNIQLCTSYE